LEEMLVLEPVFVGLRQDLSQGLANDICVLHSAVEYRAVVELLCLSDTMTGDDIFYL